MRGEDLMREGWGNRKSWGEWENRVRRRGKEREGGARPDAGRG